ncbi:NADP-dependent malic enzyme [candidate division KSB1 bacterium]|nr:NADP-dependent malic enzyme [candidate division KSB1 bacterium]NIR69775.1 NADP-dependent malic enzyme [candidate division KSB1 bacterium]NIS22958.1 NADP-dependent malic enzyme [candidate division KSB1 bacterium]NIT69815.1 NADP-dependent malic enzyme [candidate division KSB1 bacterium]NIU23489.1 NADP-dependent malic enzyme [candidate division KSB1 bacterium]
MIDKEEVLNYHARERRGKIEVCTTKPCVTQKDLSLAYTPGVAEPCREIHKNPDDIFKYTAKGNLVGVVSNGTAVLGLGDIGAGSGKPVMEGKGVLFKRFADIDVFDIEVDTHDPDEMVHVVKLLEPTFGGINLEDIKAPECFYIEETLKKQLNIPVFHDDQHGTAIISGAGLLNASELTGKKLSDMKVVICGAGAAGIACAKFYVQLGVRKQSILLCDSKGVVYAGRKEGMNPYKELFAAETEARTLADAMKGADMFCGVSGPNLVTKDMVRSMADNPIIFAMANPDPEITYDEAMAVRDDVLMATGRSDYPNQVNNVLGFPFIFRGALDVRATAINEEMKVAAAHALANLTREPVPYTVIKAYRLEGLEFGREYLIPKPFDPRVLLWEASAVAKAAMETGVARVNIDIDEYKEKLEARLGMSRKVMRVIINKAKKQPKRVVYPEGDHVPILKACEIVLDEGLAHPILLGNKKEIESKISEMHLNLDKGVEIIDLNTFDKLEYYVNTFYELRRRKGVTYGEAQRFMRRRNYFGAMMVQLGDADGLVSGLTQAYPETIRPALQIIGVRPDVHKVAGLYMMVLKDRVLFFADATVNIEPTAEDLAEIALLCAKEVRRFDVEPRIAMLSFSNFGSTRHPLAEKVRQATEIVKNKMPELIIDGEMQADTAVVPEIIDEVYSFSPLKGNEGANVLIFPNLEAGNVAYKLLQRVGGAESIGPILLGMRKPVHVLQIGDFNEIDVVNMTAFAVIDAQAGERSTFAV